MSFAPSVLPKRWSLSTFQISPCSTDVLAVRRRPLRSRDPSLNQFRIEALGQQDDLFLTVETIECVGDRAEVADLLLHARACFVVMRNPCARVRFADVLFGRGLALLRGGRPNGVHADRGVLRVRDHQRVHRLERLRSAEARDGRVQQTFVAREGGRHLQSLQIAERGDGREIALVHLGVDERLRRLLRARDAGAGRIREIEEEEEVAIRRGRQRLIGIRYGDVREIDGLEVLDRHALAVDEHFEILRRESAHGVARAIRHGDGHFDDRDVDFSEITCANRSGAATAIKARENGSRCRRMRTLLFWVGLRRIVRQ